MSFWIYFFLSQLITVLSVINSYALHQQFYPTIIYLTSSKINKVILINSIFSIFTAFNIQVVRLFFGEVREIEKLSILEKVKRKAFEFGLILIVIREDSFDYQFIFLVIGLLSFSVLHWLPIKRSEYLIGEGQVNLWVHLRVFLFFVGINCLDIFIIKQFWKQIWVQDSQSKQVMTIFAFEFVMLFIRGLFPFIKYVINLLEMATLSHFEAKFTLFSVLEFVFTTAKIVCQMILMYFIFTNFGLPLHLIGEFLENVLLLVKTFQNFANSIVLTYRLHKLENIDEQEIIQNGHDTTCLICLQIIKSGKRISCGHIFHLSCLKSWIQGNINQFCPKCKEPIKIEVRKDVQRQQQVEGTGPQIQQSQQQKEQRKKEDSQMRLMHQNSEAIDIIRYKIQQQLLHIQKLQQANGIHVSEEKQSEFLNFEVLKMQFEQKLTLNEIGSLPYAMPRPVCQNRTHYSQIQNLQLQMINLVQVQNQLYQNQQMEDQVEEQEDLINRYNELLEQQKQQNNLDYSQRQGSSSQQINFTKQLSSYTGENNINQQNEISQQQIKQQVFYKDQKKVVENISFQKTIVLNQENNIQDKNNAIDHTEERRQKIYQALVQRMSINENDEQLEENQKNETHQKQD